MLPANLRETNIFSKFWFLIILGFVINYFVSNTSGRTLHIILSIDLSFAHLFTYSQNVTMPACQPPLPGDYNSTHNNKYRLCFLFHQHHSLIDSLIFVLLQAFLTNTIPQSLDSTCDIFVSDFCKTLLDSKRKTFPLLLRIYHGFYKADKKFRFHLRLGAYTWLGIKNPSDFLYSR